MAGAAAIHEKGTVIIVNGQERIAPNEEISFEEIVALAYDDSERGGQIVFTVTFEASESRRGPEGELGPGETLKVTERAIFHVQRTDQS